MSLSSSLTAMMSAVHSSRVRMYSGAGKLTAFLYLTSSCANNSKSENETCQIDQSGRLLLILLISSTTSHLPKILILGSSRHTRTILLRASSESRKGKWLIVKLNRIKPCLSLCQRAHDDLGSTLSSGRKIFTIASNRRVP